MNFEKFNDVNCRIDDIQNNDEIPIGGSMGNLNTVVTADIDNFEHFFQIVEKNASRFEQKEDMKTWLAEKAPDFDVRAFAHMYAFEWKNKIVAVGSISSFWGSETESILLTIFVLPELHGKGIGRKIIHTLEQDEFYVRANRIEIPASITATEFYRKFGYDYKNGVKELDEEHHYRLEKFK